MIKRLFRISLLFCFFFPISISELKAHKKQSANNLRQQVQYIMTLSEKRMLEIIPDQAGIYFTDCPNCHYGTQDRGNFKWTSKRPGEIICQNCGFQFPENPNYPDKHILTVHGEKRLSKYPYYEREDGYRFYFRAHADFLAREYMSRQCQNLSELWLETGEYVYARRAALILIRFAQVYPGYTVHYDYPFKQKKFGTLVEYMLKMRLLPEFRAAKWSWWAYMDISTELLTAYNNISGWHDLQQLAGGKARQLIEHDLLGAMVQFVLSKKETYSNMSPQMWKNIISAGRVLRKQYLINEAAKRTTHFVNKQFLYDGFWKEASPSYCRQVLNHLTPIAAELKDSVKQNAYSDYALQVVVNSANDALKKTRLPDGRLLPINDTWATDAMGPRKKMRSALFPGLGAAVLGSGNGKHQIHTYLNYSSGKGHKLNDTLSFGLFAFGKEILPDIGYTHTKYRSWAVSTMSHNTVVVDGQESRLDPDWTGNRLLAFGDDGHGFQVAEAASTSAYPFINKYKRTMILVGNDTGFSYIVDVFEVDGGWQHDYLLHGSADDDVLSNVNGVFMEPFQGDLMEADTQFISPATESENLGIKGAYKLVTQLIKSKSTNKNITLTIHTKDSPTIGVKTWFFSPDTTYFLGQAPSIRRAFENDAKLRKYYTPLFCARRKGNGLKSVFIAVHIPYKNVVPIRSVQLLPSKEGIILQVNKTTRNSRDLVIINNGKNTLITENISFTGRYALLNIKDNYVTDAHVFQGARLRYGEDLDIVQPSGWTGPIRKVVRQNIDGARGYFVVDERININSTSELGALIITHPDNSQHAYNVVNITPSGQGQGCKIFVRENPGFYLDAKGNSELICFPQRTISGNQHTYFLPAINFIDNRPIKYHDISSN